MNTNHKPATALFREPTKVTIRLVNEAGTPVTWRVWRDARRPAQWMFEDHTGYVRVLSDVWATSVEKLRLVAENHRCTFAQRID